MTAAIDPLRDPAQADSMNQKAGKRGGRSRKFAVGDRVRINENAPGDYSGREGLITEIGPSQAEYRVEIEDGETPTTGYLSSSWLEPAFTG